VQVNTHITILFNIQIFIQELYLFSFATTNRFSFDLLIDATKMIQFACYNVFIKFYFSTRKFTYHRRMPTRNVSSRDVLNKLFVKVFFKCSFLL